MKKVYTLTKKYNKEQGGHFWTLYDHKGKFLSEWNEETHSLAQALTECLNDLETKREREVLGFSCYDPPQILILIEVVGE